MAYVPADVDNRVYTEVKNPSATREAFFSFIPPNGRRLLPLETIYVPGNLLGDIFSQPRRHQLGLIAAINRGACQLREIPASVFYDWVLENSRIIEVDGDNIYTVVAPPGGEESSEPEVPDDYVPALMFNDNRNSMYL